MDQEATEVEAQVADGFSSPPAAGFPAKQQADPRSRLHQLASELARSQNRRLLAEFLRLRRAMR